MFIRFLEDNRLLDRLMLSGPGERLDLAQERQRAYVRQRPLDTDTDYLLAGFVEAATLPGLAGLYDAAHNPLFRLPLSGDGAIALLAFFRARAPETGALLHDFTDAAWNTRFLGDLYQNLSEDARKRYALLQTPDFVEEWILDRTLDPAMREFGGAKVRMIDPACGSGHFLLGGSFRVLAAWQREAPDMPPAAQAQRALDAVSGVDLNPFAVEIARFRLLLAALQAAEVTRLTAAPAFRFSLTVGDSLLHGRHFGPQRDFALEVDEGFGRTLRHHYVAEDTGELDAILGRQYHAVVGNPPYITPKDAGHGTPTAILFGRNRRPVAGVVRTVRGVRREPSAPDDPAQGLVHHVSMVMLAMLFIAEQRAAHQAGLDLLSPRDIVEMLKETRPVSRKARTL